MKKLVTLRTVTGLSPIQGADRIELATIDGWRCIVKKGEFREGDTGLYFEIDSFVPASDERFKFLEKSFTLWKNRYGARIKTMKMRGEISQGLLLPLTSFPEVPSSASSSEQDFGSTLGVIKWEREGESDKQKPQTATWLGRKLKRLKYTKLKPLVQWLERAFPKLVLADSTRKFPDFIPKTDEERIQNIIHRLDRNPSRMWETSVKLDGSSMTCYYHRGYFGVCSRNFNLRKDSENRYWATALSYKLDKAMKKMGRSLAIQGELMGPGIQGNREGLKEFKYYIYKIWDIKGQRYLNVAEKQMVFAELMGLGYTVDTVPSLGIVKLDRFQTIDDFLAYAEGPSLNAPTREGVVFTDAISGQRGFKVIANSYLLKEDN